MMASRITSLIPEFNLIEDSQLRQQTIKVWQEAIKSRSWTLEDLKAMPFTLLIEEAQVNIIQHTRAVTICAYKIGQVLKKEYRDKISLNQDYLVAGALLHDVGKLFEFKREAKKFVKSEEGKLIRHPISGAAFASKYGLPSEIIHIIAAHSKEGDGARRTLEAVIVHHADFINFEIFLE